MVGLVRLSVQRGEQPYNKPQIRAVYSKYLDHLISHQPSVGANILAVVGSEMQRLWAAIENQLRMQLFLKRDHDRRKYKQVSR